MTTTSEAIAVACVPLEATTASSRITPLEEIEMHLEGGQRDVGL